MQISYWQNRANEFKADIEHITAKIEASKNDLEIKQLKNSKQHLVNEMMICLEGVERFG